MSDIVFDDPCVIFALRRESAPFLQEFPPHQRLAGSPCWARFCGPDWLSVLVLETGVGATAAEKALAWLFAPAKVENVPCRPKLVLSAGFAGGLRDDLKVGDVVLATEVVDEQGHSWPTTWPEELPPGRWDPPLLRGRVVTSSKLIGQTDDKCRLGEQHRALGVDMEAASVARACQRHGVPFGCVKAISDDMATPLSPKLLGLLAGGRVSALGVMGALATAPSLAGELWQLSKNTKKAAERLAKALGELLTLTLPWAE